MTYDLDIGQADSSPH